MQSYPFFRSCLPQRPPLLHSHVISSYRNRSHACLIPPHTLFFLLQHLPPPNPFIPDDLSLDPSLQHHLKASKEGSIEGSKEGSEVTISAPVELRSEDGLHVWHLLDLKFPVPKVCSDPTLSDYHPHIHHLVLPIFFFHLILCVI